MRSICVALLLSCVLVSVADARGPRRSRNYGSPSVTYAPTASRVIESIDESDQARCQAEANTMAVQRYTGHVGSCIGRFEGVGSGPSPDCDTCTPERSGLFGLRMTGDAASCDASGRWYRVRSWR